MFAVLLWALRVHSFSATPRFYQSRELHASKHACDHRAWRLQVKVNFGGLRKEATSLTVGESDCKVRVLRPITPIDYMEYVMKLKVPVF